MGRDKPTKITGKNCLTIPDPSFRLRQSSQKGEEFFYPALVIFFTIGFHKFFTVLRT